MPTEVVLTWNPEGFMGQLNVAISDGLNAAAQILQTEMKRNFMVRNSPGFGTWAGGAFATGAKGRGRGKKGKGPGGYVSAPFANPTYQTGRLSRALKIRRARPSLLMAVVGTTDPDFIYGVYLNEGTRKMAPRPWLTNAVYFAKQKMHAEFLKVARSANRMVAA